MKGELDLFVVRHAIAFPHDPIRWPDDSIRPLTPEGERSFRKAARGLSKVFDPVETVLASGFARAWSTAEILREEAGWGVPKAFEALEADRDANAAIAALDALDTGGVLAIVGHEPMLSEICGTLSGDASIELKKGAVARLAVRVLKPGGATVRSLLPPKVLRALSR